MSVMVLSRHKSVFGSIWIPGPAAPRYTDLAKDNGVLEHPKNQHCKSPFLDRIEYQHEGLNDLNRDENRALEEGRREGGGTMTRGGGRKNRARGREEKAWGEKRAEWMNRIHYKLIS